MAIDIITGTISPTDFEWYEFLAPKGLEEVNFWTPSGRRAFRAEPFSPFFFKLKAPYNAICGFAFFAKWTRLPDWMAWECFEVGNGCDTLAAMHSKIQKLRHGMKYVGQPGPDMIGCILLVSPVFFPKHAWVPQPSNWPERSLTPVRYDVTSGEGKRVWDACCEQAEWRDAVYPTSPWKAQQVRDVGPRFGAPVLVQPRLGQGTFRVAVTDAYQRACAVTGEHSLPALEAAHIRPYADGGEHEVSNGLLLRSDFHRLFDKGYLTVTPEHRIVVSPRLKSDYENGKSYYPFDGKQLVVRPDDGADQPSADHLGWHNTHVFLS